MMKVEAVIRPEKLNAVKASLEEIGVHGMTAYPVQGRGEQKGLCFTHRAGNYRIDMLEKTKLEIVVSEDMADAVVQTLCTVARTGDAGDGKIFVYPLARVIRVRTGEEIR